VRWRGMIAAAGLMRAVPRANDEDPCFATEAPRHADE
jgi:hypothetical protein